VINQALRACIELDDFERARNIHRQLSPDLLSNVFICTNLIRFYSQCFDYLIEYPSELFLDCSLISEVWRDGSSAGGPCDSEKEVSHDV
jgi:hypothetical protein